MNNPRSKFDSEEMREAYREWLDHPITKAVVEVLEYDSRAYKIQPQIIHPETIGLSFGIAQGRQQLIDDIKDINVRHINVNLEEDFSAPPTI